MLAKAFTQIEEVDYKETFSPVARIASIRLFLALVAHLDLELFQMDVKTLMEILKKGYTWINLLHY